MERYTRVRLLGKGSCGDATLCTDRETGESVVVKEVDLRRMPLAEREAACQEAKMLLSMEHPNVVACREAFIADGRLCIVMEHCSKGDLFAIVKGRRGPLSEPTVLDIFSQMCLGLKYIHERKILHRDIKGHNVFMTSDGTVKLGDFGIAKQLGDTAALAATAVGTPYYLSPEICQGHKYSFKTDIWSLGCVLYELIAQRPPFRGPNLQALIARIIKGSYPPLPAWCSPGLCVLVEALLTRDPKQRPSIDEVLAFPLVRAHARAFPAGESLPDGGELAPPAASRAQQGPSGSSRAKSQVAPPPLAAAPQPAASVAARVAELLGPQSGSKAANRAPREPSTRGAAPVSSAAAVAAAAAAPAISPVFKAARSTSAGGCRGPSPRGPSPRGPSAAGAPSPRGGPTAAPLARLGSGDLPMRDLLRGGVSAAAPHQTKGAQNLPTLPGPSLAIEPTWESVASEAARRLRQREAAAAAAAAEMERLRLQEEAEAKAAQLEAASYSAARVQKERSASSPGSLEQQADRAPAMAIRRVGGSSGGGGRAGVKAEVVRGRPAPQRVSELPALKPEVQQPTVKKAATSALGIREAAAAAAAARAKRPAGKAAPAPAWVGATDDGPAAKAQSEAAARRQEAEDERARQREQMRLHIERHRQQQQTRQECEQRQPAGSAAEVMPGAGAAAALAAVAATAAAASTGYSPLGSPHRGMGRARPDWEGAGAVPAAAAVAAVAAAAAAAMAAAICPSPDSSGKQLPLMHQQQPPPQQRQQQQQLRRAPEEVSSSASDTLSAEQRRRVWEEMRQAAARNKAQAEASVRSSGSLAAFLEGTESEESSATQPAAREDSSAQAAARQEQQQQPSPQPQLAPQPRLVTRPSLLSEASSSFAGSSGGGYADSEGEGDPRERRRLRLEAERARREAELREHQRRHWMEMQAAAARNRAAVLVQAGLDGGRQSLVEGSSAAGMESDGGEVSSNGPGAVAEAGASQAAAGQSEPAPAAAAPCEGSSERDQGDSRRSTGVSVASSSCSGMWHSLVLPMPPMHRQDPQGRP